MDALQVQNILISLPQVSLCSPRRQVD